MTSGVMRDVPLGELHLDPENPRFAGELGDLSEPRLVDFIAEDIGLSDILSSMSRGGFFQSSPLVSVEEEGRMVVVEGNRRLAAAIILAGDPRGVGQRARAANYPIAAEALKSLERLPVLLVPSRRDVLPYLGVAHIVGNKKWDSHAKAAWAADVLKRGLFPGGLSEIAGQIGDKHRTLVRLVEAYHLVQELEARGLFDPRDTFKKGKGTARFPFSWIYTALGYQSVREFISLSRSEADIEDLDQWRTALNHSRASELMMWLFGSESKDRKPALDDSRQISDLAAAVADDSQVRLLRRGLKLALAKEESRPAGERLADLLLDAEQALTEALGLLGKSAPEIPLEEMASLAVTLRRIRDAATTLSRQMGISGERMGNEIAEG